MRFSSREDIEAPIASVFATLSEFESFERSALRRGIEVQRIHMPDPMDQGAVWTARFQMRGRMRDLKLQLVEFEPPNVMRFESQSLGLDGELLLDLVPLSQKRTRMGVSLTLSPKTLPARLLIQSLKLAKSNLTKRFKLKVADYAKSMEDRHQRSV
ncbi:MAG: SRPBCC family protein [Sedimentitalea sp.]